MTTTMQDEFEADYCEHSHRLPALVRNCRLSNGSYGDPCIAKAWHWFRRSREMLVVQLPEFWDCGAGGMVIGEDELLTALGAAGLKVTL